MNSKEKDKINYPDYIEHVFEFIIPKGQVPLRIDRFLTDNIKNASRNKVQKAIDDGLVTINNEKARNNKKVKPEDKIICKIMRPPPIELKPENIPLDIYHEDDHLLVVNKPSGMCSHPGFGNRYGTLINGVLWHIGMRDSIAIEAEDEENDDDNSEGEIFASDDIRPGLVHRLDKDTSGLLVVAKDSLTLTKLQQQFKARTTSRFYYAIVWGKLKDSDGTIVGNIARSSRDRKKFAVTKKGGKFARTDYDIQEELIQTTLVKVKLHTGRTHQIRVHLKHIGNPLFGDMHYGGDKMLYSGQDPYIRRKLADALSLIDRQMLHAKTLGFVHPHTGQRLQFESPLPEDMKRIILELKA